MKTYAMVRGGIVLSHFTTDKTPADFPDIAPFLFEAPEDVRDGMHFDGEAFTDPPAVVPQTVTMRQARLALLGAGYLDAVEAAINGMPSPQKEAARIAWDFSSEVQRNFGLVASLGPALGLSSAQIDALFISASGL